MTLEPEDERARKVQALLVALGPKGVELLADNLTEAIALAARLEHVPFNSRVPNAAIAAAERELMRQAANQQNGCLLIRLDYAYRPPASSLLWRLLAGAAEVVIETWKTWKPTGTDGGD